MNPSFYQPEAFSLESLMNGPVRQALGIQTIHGSQSNNVFAYLSEDFMKPVIHIGILVGCIKRTIRHCGESKRMKLVWIEIVVIISKQSLAM